MIAAKVERSYRAYATITREQAFARGFDGKYINAGYPERITHYDYSKARELLTQYPLVIAVDFVRHEHNDSKARYNPPDGYVAYVKASSGKWGKSSVVRVGKMGGAE